MERCLICGTTHTEKIGGNLILSIFGQASFFKNVIKGVDISNNRSPLCMKCTEDFLKFIDDKSGLIAAEFLCWVVEKQTKSNEIKKGLGKAKSCGKRLGRPKIKIDADKIMGLKNKGYGIRRISRELGVSKSTVDNRLKELLDG